MFIACFSGTCSPTASAKWRNQHQTKSESWTLWAYFYTHLFFRIFAADLLEAIWGDHQIPINIRIAPNAQNTNTTYLYMNRTVHTMHATGILDGYIIINWWSGNKTTSTFDIIFIDDFSLHSSQLEQKPNAWKWIVNREMYWNICLSNHHKKNVLNDFCDK